MFHYLLLIIQGDVLVSTLDTFDNQVFKLDFCFLILSKLNRRQICRLYLVIFMRA
jgi:hypothetical protein